MSFPIAVLPPLRTPKSASARPATSSPARGGAPTSSPPGHAANGGGGVNFMSMGGFHATGTTDAPRRVRHAGAGAGGERVGEGGLGGVRGRYLRACSASARPATSGCGSGVRRSAAAGGGLFLHGREVPHSGAAFLLLPRRALAARARPRFRAARCPGTSTACSTTWDGRLGMVVVVVAHHWWVSAERSGLRGRRLPPRSRPASSRVGLVFLQAGAPSLECLLAGTERATRGRESEAGSSYATGFVVDARRGIILTNRHVVKTGAITPR